MGHDEARRGLTAKKARARLRALQRFKPRQEFHLMNDGTTTGSQSLAPKLRSFAAMRHSGFRAQFSTYVLAMMADNIEHVISYWMVFQKFQSPALGGFAVVSHWLPFLLFSVATGALAARVELPLHNTPGMAI